MLNTSTEKCCWNDALFWRHLRTLAPAKPPDPPSARKFFAGSAQNLALSLRFRAIGDAKVGAKGRFGAL
jgi:hypothetical protein